MHIEVLQTNGGLINSEEAISKMPYANVGNSCPCCPTASNDVIITDIRMSRLNGFELYRELRKGSGNIRV
jgi:CheY-like chemotaxis protein